jgi:protein SCO1
MRQFRWAAWAAVGLVLLGWAVSGWLAPAPPARTSVTRAATPGESIGRPLDMVDQRGAPVTDQTYAGRPLIVFFGFTSCPDVCPTTLSDITGWLQELGAQAADLQPILISVDPERDTTNVLANYMSAFDPRIVALTGTSAQVVGAASAFRAVYKKVPDANGGYTMDHTATVFLVDRAGRLFATVDLHEDRSVALAKLRRLLAMPRQ